MKPFFTLLFILLFTASAFADQALVLTEIEQIQEKIWYLQRDVAAQKAALEKHQEDIRPVMADANKKQQLYSQRLDALAELINSQHEKTKQIEDNLQTLREAVSALVNEFNQQNTAQLQQAEKTGAQEGLLQALREDVIANREKTEEALQETAKQLSETRARLAAMQEQEGSHLDRIGLYLGGTALALAILLTIAFAFLNSRSKQSNRDSGNRPNHEL